MSKYICFHGHFYQPPRENPWTNLIDPQPSAAPFHDWNERITSESYLPNAKLHTYEHMNFNFGPTLIQWLADHDLQTYEAILKADSFSKEHFKGHGNAIAQAYNHIILPLANENDKQTQVIWGIKDFEFRFQRKPEGMWLPETAVDLKTLDVLAEHDIKYTILAPKQAYRIRKIGDAEWIDVSGGAIQTKRVYMCSLPSGRSIALFFYDGYMSSKIAFGGYTKSVRRFQKGIENELHRAFDEDEDRLLHSAVDGETYGHHHKKGHEILKDVLDFCEMHEDVELTNYGLFLETHPPQYEVEILENTAWSCEAGLHRWSEDDRHSYDTHTRKVHKWRRSLRDSLDWLRDCLIPIYEREMHHLCTDPRGLRNRYIDVLLKKDSQEFRSHLTDESQIDRAVLLLEMQKFAMFMYTSCGWFFEDISRIETIQILRYAARAMHIAKIITGVDFEEEFLTRLEQAQSKDQHLSNGRGVYLKYVKPLVEIHS